MGSLCYYCFLLNLLDWHWFTKAHRFQVYNSIKHHLHSASCAPCTKRGLFLSPAIHPLPTSTCPSPAPFPSGCHHPVVCVYVLCIWVSFLLNPFTFSSNSPLSPPLWELSVYSMYPCLCFYIVHQFILFIRFTKIWKQPKCPSVEEKIKKQWYIYTVERYLAVKKKQNGKET